MAISAKERVRSHWEAESCGIRYAAGAADQSFYRSIEETRYALEPFILDFADFASMNSKHVLEIGVGAGTDFSRFVQAGAITTGIDLTQAAIDHTTRRLAELGIGRTAYTLQLGDAETLAAPDRAFDLVYSWGVLHHTPDTARAFGEAQRVLKSGGRLKAMIYHARSWTAWMLWFRYALLSGRPWLGPRRCVFQHLESPGTKAYTPAEARRMLEQAGFTNITVRTRLGPGDLLNITPSNRYSHFLYRAAWKAYPRWLIRVLGNRFGLYLLVTAEKP